MSGGKFDYKQYELNNIADSIQFEIDKNGKAKTPEEIKEESWHDSEWYKKYPEDLNHHKYSDEVIMEFVRAIGIIKKAAIYIHEIDYLLSGDTGEESFLQRLKEKL